MRESCLRTSGERSTEFHQMNLLCFKVLYKKVKIVYSMMLIEKNDTTFSGKEGKQHTGSPGHPLSLSH